MRYLKLVIFLNLISGVFIAVDVAHGKEAADTTAVEVEYVSGTVEVCSPTDAEFIKVEEDMLLEAGAKIKTGENAYVELAFDEGGKNIIRINSGSSVQLTLEENEKLMMEKGEVIASVSSLPQGSSFEIRTPTVVAGARGTQWTTRVENEETIVEAFEDNPFVKSIDAQGRLSEEVKVLAGHMTTVKKFQQPAPLSPVPLQRQQQHNELRGQMQQHKGEAAMRRQTPEGMRRREGMRQDFKERLQNREQGQRGMQGGERGRVSGPDKMLISGDKKGYDMSGRADQMQSNGVLISKEGIISNGGPRPGEKMQGPTAEGKRESNRDFQPKEARPKTDFSEPRNPQNTGHPSDKGGQINRPEASRANPQDRKIVPNGGPRPGEKMQGPTAQNAMNKPGNRGPVRR